MKHAPILVIALTLCGDGRAQAQASPGSVTARSDVKMSIEGAVGTGGDRLDALAQHLGTPLGEVKHCYGELVKSRPDVTGTWLVDLELPEKGHIRVSPVGAEKLNKTLRKCVEGAFSKITGKNVPRPAKARVVLELSNSAADSQQDVREREEEASRVEIKTDAEGASFSEGRSLQGEMDFRVSARGADAAGLVESVHTAVRDSLPGLFDCRRKSSKNGSPEGELVLAVSLAGKSKPQVEVRSNTVQSERASPCVDRVMTQGLANRGRGRAQIKIHFSP